MIPGLILVRTSKKLMRMAGAFYEFVNEVVGVADVTQR
jgi:hypothetical protein